MHCTHAVPPAHFFAVGQSLLLAHRTQAPLLQTWPLMLVAQSLLLVHPPPFGVVPPLVQPAMAASVKIAAVQQSRR